MYGVRDVEMMREGVEWKGWGFDIGTMYSVEMRT